MIVKPWPRDPDYLARKDGTILSRKIKGPGQRIPGGFKILKGESNNKGYIRLCLMSKGKTINVYAHTIVLESFVGPCPPGMQCRHLDGNGSNNHIKNIRWGTPLENIADRGRHGNHPRGERNGSAKLDRAIVAEIRSSPETGIAIAARLSIHRDTVYRIRRRERWIGA